MNPDINNLWLQARNIWKGMFNWTEPQFQNGFVTEPTKWQWRICYRQTRTACRFRPRPGIFRTELWLRWTRWQGWPLLSQILMLHRALSTPFWRKAKERKGFFGNHLKDPGTTSTRWKPSFLICSLSFVYHFLVSYEQTLLFMWLQE